ncbi:hypothetical protein FHR70_002682 [Microvirga lupini]|uniref:Uncharacterized protein n=1 Tax=Microvirga lupini TaxID=420324 RepID=A0A7W4VLY2_9HYPH|nr:hypothetical protein [Microvirga lupini]MBB3019617.1 hypothetical protein [Microvirga lupini]
MYAILDMIDFIADLGQVISALSAIGLVVTGGLTIRNFLGKN